MSCHGRAAERGAGEGGHSAPLLPRTYLALQLQTWSRPGEYQLKILVFLGTEERNTQSQTHTRKTPATQAPPAHRPRGQQAANKCHKRATARAAHSRPGTTATSCACGLGRQTPHSPRSPPGGRVWEAARPAPVPGAAAMGPPEPAPLRFSWAPSASRSRLRERSPTGCGQSDGTPRGEGQAPLGPTRLEAVGQTDQRRPCSRLSAPTGISQPALGLLQPWARPREGAQGHTSSLTASWTSAVTNTDVGWSPGVSQLRTLCLHHNRGARWTWACESGSGVT